MPKAAPKKKNSIVFPKTSVPNRPGKKIQDVVVVHPKGTKKLRKHQPTANQRAVFQRVLENVKKGEKVSITKAMRESGAYSKATSKHPEKVTDSLGWETLMNTYLPDSLLAQKHKELLESTTVDHMVFPLGPKETEDDGAASDAEERTTLTDKEIVSILAEVNCTVRRIVHGETSRHVYFWAADNRARKDALDMAYKLRGRFKETPQPLDTGTNQTLDSINTLVKMLNEERAKNK